MASILTTREVEIRHFHAFCGVGGAALGFNRGHARVGQAIARMRCIGGFDADPGAVASFTRLVGVSATLLDAFDRDQYRAYHGREAPADWQEAGPEDIRRAAHGERPHILFGSPPCRGFSGLLSGKSAGSVRYQTLNELALRGIWLCLEAWEDDPPELVVLENVPRIASRGRALLDEIGALLRAYGYAVAETTHNCGELGGLAQVRHRFLLAARHKAKVPPFLYEPQKRRLRSIGEVISALPYPLPGADNGHPMHRRPLLQWRTLVRLACIPAGRDWRALEKLRVENGYLKDLCLVPVGSSWHHGVLGVRSFAEAAATVTAGAGPTTGAHGVADPRVAEGAAWHKGILRVQRLGDTAATVTGEATSTRGAYSIADPRVPCGLDLHSGVFGVRSMDGWAPTITGESFPTNGAFNVADPRIQGKVSSRTGRENAYRQYGVQVWDAVSNAVTAEAAAGTGPFSVADPRASGWRGVADPRYALSIADPRLECDSNDGQRRRFNNVYRLVAWTEAAAAITAGAGRSSGGLAVADPRLEWGRRVGGDWRGGGHYGVRGWDETSAAVLGHAGWDNGPFSVADLRVEPAELVQLPGPEERCQAIIIALDGTDHRPLTTAELALLQGFDLDVMLASRSDSKWRLWIGNAVPPPAAAAIASTMAHTLLLAWAGRTFELSSRPIWVQPLDIALSVDVPAWPVEARA